MRHYLQRFYLRIFAPRRNHNSREWMCSMENGMAKPEIEAGRRTAPKPRAATSIISTAAALGALLLLGANAVVANPSRDQAMRIYNRIAGIPASDLLLTQMTGTDPLSA